MEKTHRLRLTDTEAVTLRHLVALQYRFERRNYYEAKHQLNEDGSLESMKRSLRSTRKLLKKLSKAVGEEKWLKK